MSPEAPPGAAPRRSAPADSPPGEAVPGRKATAPAADDGAAGPKPPVAGGRSRQPSLGGGAPAQDRELRAQGRQTVQRLLEAGLAEFYERGFQGVRVDDVVRRAKTSHGTFYLYFKNKDDLFKALLRDALHDMEAITDAFPLVSRDEAGRAALRQWVSSFCETYAAHAAVIGILSQAELVGEEVWGDGMQVLYKLAKAMARGMTATSDTPSPDGQAGLAEQAELTAFALLMMLERVNYLLSEEIPLPKDEMVDRLTAIIFAAFHSP
jgi:AcrR family transcriptional regulator